MDVRISLALIVGLSIVAALCVGGIVIVDAFGREPPANLGTLAGTCIGALSMLLVHPSAHRQQPTDASAVNTMQSRAQRE